MQMKQIWRFSTLVWTLFAALQLPAQMDSTWQQNPAWAISGFMDVYYVYDFNQPEGAYRQPFLYNHNRHNEFNLNLGLLRMRVEHPKYRANLALQAGTYANDNYVAEPDLLKSVFEASIGLSLNRKNNLWLDAGVLPSHIGFESAVSMDNWTLTRSLAAENSPYFLSGAKLTFRPSEQWELVGLVVNGWQRIQRVAGNTLPSWGTQVKFSPSQRISLNWSTFVGTDDPDDSRRMRYFNNVYGQFQCSDNLGILAGCDIGTQQSAKGSADYDVWFTPVIIGQWVINPIWKTAVRVEYFHDAAGIIVPTSADNGFRTVGISLNVDYAPAPRVVCRLEGRWLGSQDDLFEARPMPVGNNVIIGASMAIAFTTAPKD